MSQGMLNNQLKGGMCGSEQQQAHAEHNVAVQGASCVDGAALDAAVHQLWSKPSTIFSLPPLERIVHFHCTASQNAHRFTCGRGVLYSSDTKSGRKKTSGARNLSWRTAHSKGAPVRESVPV